MQRKKEHFFRNIIVTAFFSCLMLSSVQAAKPLWTFAPQTATDITIAKGGSAQVTYTVQNQSSIPKTLLMKPIAGISQSAPCQLPAKGICTLTLNLNGTTLQGDVVGGPVLCQQGNDLQCYQPSSTNILRIRLKTLSPLTQNLALSIKSPLPDSDPALVGTPRIIRIQNTGLESANNVQVSTSGLPAGTFITSNTCVGTLNTGATCDITITPGATASANNIANPCTTSPGTEPEPATVTVSADNTPSTNVNVLVLGYGCIYQGGFLFSVDDTTSNTGSIGGKVAALTNEQDSSWSTISYDAAANSITDGLANSNALANPVGQYPAAQACLNKSDQGFTDWFMPAICELGRYSNPPGSSDAGCGDMNPNLYTTLHTKGLGGFDQVIYWSSTQSPVNPSINAWFQIFLTGGQDYDFFGKDNAFRVRCVRAFIP